MPIMNRPKTHSSRPSASPDFSSAPIGRSAWPAGLSLGLARCMACALAGSCGARARQRRQAREASVVGTRHVGNAEIKALAVHQR
jgi:hypothetical protein